MKHIKERCLWFIGRDRQLRKGYKYFMYCYDDIILFQEFTPFGIDRYDKVPIVGRSYVVGKVGLVRG